MTTGARHFARERSGGLLEREQELGRVEAALRSAVRGSGLPVMVVAGAGLGKSSLLESARGRCGELGLKALSARCEELEVTLPWALARQLLVPALVGVPPSRRRGLLSGAAAPAAAVLDPASASTTPRPGGELLPLAHALFWVIAGLAERSPLALLVDDAHWADAPSLRLLVYLARRLSDLPVALLVSRRPGQPGAEAGPLDELTADPATERIELAPLSPEAATTLACDALGATDGEELVAACVKATGGNPFYLCELLRAVRATGDARIRAETVERLVPAAVSSSVFLRISRLSREAVALARAAAVLGDRATLPHAAELAGVDVERAAVALDQLAFAEILSGGEPLRFIHPLLAAAIHDDLPPAERAAWHFRAAKVLDRAGVESALIAPHLLAAGARADPWVAEKLEAAAASAAAQGGTAAAAMYLTRALDEPPPRAARPRLLAELGRLESALGWPTAPERVRAALELSGGGDRRARLLFDLGRALVVAGEHGEAARAFESGLAVVKQSDSELARELRAAWWMAATVDPVGRARVLAAGDPELGDALETPTLGQRQLLAQLAQERAFAGRPPEELMTLAERAWGDGALLAGETSDGLSWSLVTGALLIADALELGLEVCDTVIADARRRGSPMAYATASYCRAWPLLVRGQVSDAIADAEAAVDARSDGWAMFLPMAGACLALGLVERGALEDASAALALAQSTPDLERSNQYPMVLMARGRVLAAQRRFEASVAALLEAGERVQAIRFDNPTMFSWRADAAHAAVLAGEPGEARALADQALTAANRIQVPVAIARALRAVAAANGEQAVDHLRRGLTLLPDAPRLERIHLLVDLGAALRRANQRSSAAEALRQGLALAQRGGAGALARRARSELSALGIRVARAPTRDGAEALTPAEQRVAELAADGHTNREIAQLLFVTVKTVEYHLGNAYRKLGVNRRSQLAAHLPYRADPA